MPKEVSDAAHKSLEPLQCYISLWFRNSSINPGFSASLWPFTRVLKRLFHNLSPHPTLLRTVQYAIRLSAIMELVFLYDCAGRGRSSSGVSSGHSSPRGGPGPGTGTTSYRPLFSMAGKVPGAAALLREQSLNHAERQQNVGPQDLNRSAASGKKVGGDHGSLRE